MKKLVRPYLMFASRAKPFLGGGCLAHVKEETGAVKKLAKEVLVVRDYPDVFLEDLLGLPPNWEIEFSIDRFLV